MINFIYSSFEKLTFTASLPFGKTAYPCARPAFVSPDALYEHSYNRYFLLMFHDEIEYAIKLNLFCYLLNV